MYIQICIHNINEHNIYLCIDKISKCITHLKVELPIFVAIATFSAPLIMAVRHIVILTRQTNFSGLFLLPHSMVEAMAMVKKTPPGHFEPTLVSEKYYPPQNKQPLKNRGSRDGNFSGDMFSCREGTSFPARAPQKTHGDINVAVGSRTSSPPTWKQSSLLQLRGHNPPARNPQRVWEVFPHSNKDGWYPNLPRARYKGF